jgi:hypothetical protein
MQVLRQKVMRMPRLPWTIDSRAACFGLAAMLASTACPRPLDTAEPDGSGEVRGGSGDAAPVTEPVRIDGARMHALVKALADDELGGRYTFVEADIGRAAQMLADAYRDGGLAKVGPAYRVDYPVITGVAETSPAALAITRAGKPVAVPAASFAARSNSGSASAAGDVVFVGYAARSRVEGDAGGAPAYDDLAGIDVKGKVALVLLETPGRPDGEAMSDALRAEAKAFESATEDARAKKDTAALARAHVAMRKRIAKMAAPWLRGKALPKSFTAAPADPLARVDVRGIAASLVDAAEALPGPKFDIRQGRLRTKLARLSEAGAVAAIVVEGPRSYVDAKARETDALPGLDASRPGIEPAAIPVVQMRWHDADALFRIGKRKLSAVQAVIDRELVPQSSALVGTTATVTVAMKSTSVSVPNVLAQLEGGEKKDEIVVIGAHFDHVGRDGSGQCHTDPGDAAKDGVCNGADDNASGSAMVVEVARALAAAHVKPKRTIVFANFSGEEVGLHGSKALAESPPSAPPFANGKVVAMVNLDMVGRMDARGLAIGGLSSSSGWMKLLDAVGPHGIGVMYDRAITTRSDHASFYRKDIPVLFFFTHLHPDYHRPGDEIDAINGDGMTKIAELVADLVQRLGDGAEVPFTPPKNEDEGLTGALPGTNPATVEKRVNLPAPGAAPAL